MKVIIFCLGTACLIGCLPFQQTGEPEAPQLIFQVPLPVIPESDQKLPSEISLTIFVLENGTVEQVRFSKSSETEEWDSLAVLAIKQWRFTPARLNNKPYNTWYHMRAPLHYTAPLFLTLAEITCATEETADSIYDALDQGREFSDLVKLYSLDTSRENHGIIGEVNIYCYPEHIRHSLTRLDIEDYTKPILYGDKYVIFKRMKK